MPIFKCSKCGCVDNTATSNFWTRDWDAPEGSPPSPPLCSACDPKIGKWHGAFEKKSAEGLEEGPDGFLYDPNDPYLLKQKAGR